MATPAQTRANQENALYSSGPTSTAGREASSKNHTLHGLSSSLHSNATFYFLDDENVEKYNALKARLGDEYKPQTETERILVRRLLQHEWLRARALRLQRACLAAEEHVHATTQFALYLRYQTTHERAFYKALTELQKLRAERRKEQIGFESQKRAQAAETRADRALNLKEQEFEIKKLRFERSQKPSPTPNSQSQSPGALEMAA